MLLIPFESRRMSEAETSSKAKTHEALKQAWISISGHISPILYDCDTEHPAYSYFQLDRSRHVLDDAHKGYYTPYKKWLENRKPQSRAISDVPKNTAEKSCEMLTPSSMVPITVSDGFTQTSSTECAENKKNKQAGRAKEMVVAS